MKNTKTKLFSVLVVVAMLLAVFAVGVFASDSNAAVESLAGSGTEVDPYLINSVEELKWFRDDVNAGNTYSGKYVKLTDDVDLGNEEWTPIGNSSKVFAGYFDGNGKTVYNLTVSGSNDYAGFFGYIKGTSMAEDATPTVKSLTLDGVSVSGDYYVGGLAGQGYTCTVTDVTVKGNVSGTRYVGGLIGHVYTYFSDCHFVGDASCSFDALGGIAGAGDCRAYDCSVIGDITGSNWVGGIVGNGQEGTSAVRCYVKGTVSTANNYYCGIGGIAGVAGHGYASTKFVDNYFDGEVYCAGEKVNSIITGLVNADSNDVIEGTFEGNSFNTEYYDVDTPIYVTAEVPGSSFDGWAESASETLTAPRNNNLVMLESDIQYVDATNMDDVTVMSFSAVAADNADLVAKVAENVNVAFVDTNGNGAYDEGEVKYTDLQEAIKAAAPAGTVEVMRDVTVDEWVMFAERLHIGNGDIITLVIDGLTINGNGHTLTVNSIESAGNGNNLFFDATNLNINDLTIKYADGVAGGIGLKSGTLSNVTFDGGVYGVLPGEGNVTVTGCTFKTDGTSIYFEAERDNLVVTGNTFANPSNVNVILLRGNVTFTDNVIESGRTVNVVSGSPVVTGNDFGDVRFKVYNDATASITDNTINNLVFNEPEAPAFSSFSENTLSEDAEAALEAVVVVAQIGDNYYGTLEAAFAVVQNGDTIKLLTDIATDKTYTIADGISVTLDMNGKKITATDNATGNYELFYILGELTVTGNGTIELTATTNREWYNLSAIFHNRGGVLNIENGTYKHLGGTDMAWVVDNSGNWYGDATTNIYDGVLYSTYTAIRNRMEQNSHGASGTTYLNIYGGSVDGETSAIWAQAASESTTSPATGEINISGGEIGIVNTARSAGAECMTTVTGGTVEAIKCEVGELTVSGGSVGAYTILDANGNSAPYSIDDSGKFVEATVTVTDTNGTTVGYTNLLNALAAVQNGDTVTLLAACDEDVTVIQTADVSFTINGNDKTYTGTITVNGNRRSTGAETLTIKNVNFVADTDDQSFVVMAQNTYAHNVTVEGCNFDGKGISGYAVNIRHAYNIAVVDCYGTDLFGLVYAPKAVSGLTVEGSTVENSSYGIHASYPTNVTIKDVTVDASENGIYIRNNSASSTVIEDVTVTAATPIVFNQASTNTYSLTFNGDNNITATEGDAWLTVNGTANAGLKLDINDDGLDIAKTSGVVASIGEAHYSSLANAIAAAKDGDVIVLVNDVTVDKDDVVYLDGESYYSFFKVTGKSVTVDLNGKSVYGDAAGLDKWLVGMFSTELDGHLVINDSVGNATVKVDANGATVYSLIVCYDESSSVVIDGGSYELDVAKDSLIYSSEDETITVNGGNFTLGNVGTGVNGSPWIFNARGQNTRNIIVNGGTFNADIVHQYYPFEVMVPETAALKDNGDGTYTLIIAVAYVNEQEYSGRWYTNYVGYATLKEALEAAAANVENAKKAGVASTVTLLTDLENVGKLTIKAGVTLDGNDHTITGNSSFINQLYTAGTFVIKNCVFKEISNGNGTLSPIYIERYVEGTVVVIENNVFDGNEWDSLAITLHGYGAVTSVTTPASITVRNNVFKDSDETTSTKRYIHFQPIYSGEVSLPVDLTVTGNKIYDDGVKTAVGVWYADANANVDLSGNYIENLAKVEVTFVENGENVNAIAALLPLKDETLANDVEYVAAVVIDEYTATLYTSLADAFAAAEKGNVIEILADVTLTEQIKVADADVLSDITVNGNGHTLTGDLGANASFLYFGNTATGAWATGVKINDLTIDSTSARFGIALMGGTTSELTNVTVKGNFEYYGINLYGTHGATLTGCDISTLFTNGSDDYPLTLVDTKIGHLFANKSDITEGAKVFAQGASTIDELTFWGESTVMIDTSALEVVETVNATLVAENDGVYYTTLASAIAAAEDGDTVTLLADVTVAEAISIDKAITVDLGGFTVTSTAKDAFRINANTTIENGTVIGTNRCINTRAAVELTLNSVTLEATNYTSAYGNTQPLTIGGSDNGTKVTLNGCTVDAGDTGYAIITFVQCEVTVVDSDLLGYAALYVKNGSDNSTFTVDADSTINVAGGNEGFGAIVLEGVEGVTVTVDGTLTSGDYAVSFSDITGVACGENTVNLNGNVTVGDQIIVGYEDGVHTVTTTNADVAAALNAEGYAMVENNGVYTVTVGNFKIGDKYFATLADAVAAAGKNETTITFLDNVQISSIMIGHSFAQNITLDLNGYTLSSTSKAITVYRAGTVVTIINGTVSGNASGGTISVSYGGSLILGDGAVIACGGGSATGVSVDQGSLTVEEGATILGGKVAIAMKSGTTTVVNGGTVALAYASGNDVVSVADGASFTVNGGAFGTDVSAYCDAMHYTALNEETGYYEYTLVPDVKLYGVNMTLDSNLALNYWFYKDSLLADGKYYAVVIQHHEPKDETNNTGCGYPDRYIVIPYELWDNREDGDIIGIHAEDIAAKDLICQIEVLIFRGEAPEAVTSLDELDRENELSILNRDTSGEFVPAEISTSMELYAFSSIYAAELAGDTDTMTMFVDMLNYSAAAQKHFGHNVSHYANHLLYEYANGKYLEYASASVPTVSGSQYVQTGYGYGSSFSLENTIELNLYFFISDAEAENVDFANLSASATYTDYYGDEYTLEYTASDLIVTDGTDYNGVSGKYVNVKVDTLSPADGRTLVTATLYDGENEIGSVRDSIMELSLYNYLTITNDDDLKAVYEMIAKFAESANKVLSKKN